MSGPPVFHLPVPCLEDQPCPSGVPAAGSISMRRTDAAEPNDASRGVSRPYYGHNRTLQGSTCSAGDSHSLFPWSNINFACAPERAMCSKNVSRISRTVPARLLACLPDPPTAHCAHQLRLRTGPLSASRREPPSVCCRAKKKSTSIHRAAESFRRQSSKANRRHQQDIRQIW